VKIVKLKKSNLKSFFKYFDLNYKNNHILKKSRNFFNWQYLSQKSYNFYFIKIKNKIKSIQGIIPTSLYDKKIKNITVFLSMWHSSGIATGAKLIINLQKKIKCNLLVGLGSSNQSFKFQKILNYKCGYLSHFFLTSKKKKKKLISPENFSNNKKKIKKLINYEELTNKKSILLLDKKIFNYQEPKKTSRYLINRYLKHPIYKYYIYGIKNKKGIFAIFVFRICVYKNSSAIRIVDFAGSNSSFPKGKYIFNYLLEKHSSDYIDIYCYGIPEEYLRLANLENIKKYQKKNIIIPNYFEPFQKKNIKLRYAYKIKKKISKNIRFFKGDSDLDRPSNVH
jgi:hypothetical protein